MTRDCGWLHLWGRFLLATLLLFAGCTIPPLEKPAVPPTPPAPPRPPPEAMPLPPPVPLRELPVAPSRPTPPAPAAPTMAHHRAPMPTRPIDLAMRCAAMDERHHTVQADVDIRDGEVRYLRARLTEPQGGSCEFSLNDFRQTRRLPSIELQSRKSSCVLRVWEQDPQVVLAYGACEAHCTSAGTFGQMLPILFDRRVGHCD